MPVTIAEKQEFIIAQLKPYLLDPSTCAYDKKYNGCKYLTNDGKMCVVGKNLANPEDYKENYQSVEDFLSYDQEALVESARGKLSSDIWGYMQLAHDHLSTGDYRMVLHTLKKIENYTSTDLIELKELVNKLKIQ